MFFTFLVNNDLFRLRLKLSRSSHISHDEFDEVEKRFLAGRFPADIIEQFRNMLDYFGQAPIIVRSSSLLEDSYGNAFAGKYRSEFCANQGSPEQRLEAFLRAVKLVYASALNPDALSYRRRRGLGENEEQMAILVMRVSGMPCGGMFFPTLAGVAFSRNLYAWSDRIDPKQGVIRLVFGLGTHAVNRVGGDYPRMIAVSHPQLRPEIGFKIAKYSQHEMDLLDLQANALATRSVTEVLADAHVSQPPPAGFGDPGRPPVRPVQPRGAGRAVAARAHLQQPHRPHRFCAADRAGAGRPGEGLRAPGGYRVHRARGGRREGADQPAAMPAPVAAGRPGPRDLAGGTLRPDRVLFRSDRFISGGEVPPSVTFSTLTRGATPR